MLGLNLEIKDFGKINEANIEINKINVVGGVNASGKSTASKLLYCFLKSISKDREEYILAKVIQKFNNIINYIKFYPSENYYNHQGEIDLLANRFDVLCEYDKYRDEINELMKNANEDIHSDLKITVPLLKLLKEDNDNILTSYSVSSLLFDESLMNFTPEDLDYGYHIFKGYIKFFTDSFESLIHNDITVVHYDSSDLIDIESNADFDWRGNNFYHLTNGSIKKINHVFYIGNLSYLDLNDYESSFNSKYGKMSIGYEEHMDYLINNLNNDDFKSKLSEDVIKILKKIQNIIEGSFQSVDYMGYSFSQNFGENISPSNISSGIKQIGILQLLLFKNKLSSGSFLIIDEPEVNLHPDWQFKFAQILVLLAKELDITIYLNSHSPTFIDSIDAFTEFYDMGDEINYYLTEEYGDKYNFTKINSNELYKIYNNLGNVYDKINKLRIRKRLSNGD